VLLRRYIVGVKLFGALLLVGCSLCAQTARGSLDEGFDEPLKKTVVDLGPSPYYRPTQHVRKTLTCYAYSTFTVKQYDEGQKGAELSIVPSAHATCTRTHSKGEIVLTWREWRGYFWGAKGTYAIFGAPDGEDGGLPFAVFDVKTGRKLFEDSSLLDYYQEKLKIKNTFRINSGTDGFLRLTYLRVVRVGCNLKAEAGECWKKARNEFGITQTDMPVCSGYELADRESAVVYPVSVLLTDSPQIRAVDGPVFCWPTD
jgi:hypothetical protein